ncbi:Acetyltransferase (GNAT) family protein [Glycomyces sambucus]|uniref:Acetyltransferase (GNAT) family protein n=1 Tax=Glycomyces sambucus TaxID=380244 RepID=A0A1G9HX00_9ACTN|nr:GNAT family N-acetyltransferase [Glycomyces sambucus]SDL17537.1 Acetyltransferase (GNAT) family protein [Glycomyces sambucus]
MQIRMLDPADDRAVTGAIALKEAVRAADAPEYPRPVEQSLRAALLHPRPGLDVAHWTAIEDGGTIGYLSVSLFTDDNPHLAAAELMVHPDHRRRGHGAALLRRCIDFAAANGRTAIVLRTPTRWSDGPPRPEAGAKFLEDNGFAVSFVNVRSRLHLSALEPEAEQRLWARSVAASGPDYELRTWTGPAPDDLFASLCRLDAKRRTEIPMGDMQLEAEAVDLGRAREKEDVLAAVHQVPVKAAAVHRTTGRVAAFTDLRAFEDPDTAHAFQDLTIVDPAHRGHRLGLLVKLANLRQTRRRFPQIKEIWAENADVNERMIAINTALGFRTVDAVSVYQRKLQH